MTESVEKILALLEKEYPDAEINLDQSSPVELVVSVILSAQCTDARVNLVTPALFRKYRTFSDFSRAKLPDLERMIHSTGFFRNKAKNIRNCCREVVEKCGGRLPETLEELIELPGIGRKSGNVIISNIYGRNEGVIVDTHVFRLARRLGLSEGNTPEKVERDLMKLLPQRDWLLFSNLLVFHGRAVCNARKPLCGNCSLRKLCPSVRENPAERLELSEKSESVPDFADAQLFGERVPQIMVGR
ncbi:MAG: endonuclease III [archaeon]